MDRARHADATDLSMRSYIRSICANTEKKNSKFNVGAVGIICKNSE